MVLQIPADIPQMHVTAEDLRHQIIALAKDYSVETTPRECAITDSYRGWLSPGTRVNIACISGSDYDSVIRTAAQLRVEGFDPVPHIPARVLRRWTTCDVPCSDSGNRPTLPMFL